MRYCVPQVKPPSGSCTCMLNDPSVACSVDCARSTRFESKLSPKIHDREGEPVWVVETSSGFSIEERKIDSARACAENNPVAAADAAIDIAARFIRFLCMTASRTVALRAAEATGRGAAAGDRT